MARQISGVKTWFSNTALLDMRTIDIDTLSNGKVLVAFGGSAGFNSVVHTAVVNGSTGKLGPVERTGRTFKIAVDGQCRCGFLAPQFGRDQIAAVRRRDQRLRRGRADRHKCRAKAQRQRANRNRGTAKADRNRAKRSGRLRIHFTLRVGVRT